MYTTRCRQSIYIFLNFLLFIYLYLCLIKQTNKKNKKKKHSVTAFFLWFHDGNKDLVNLQLFSTVTDAYCLDRDSIVTFSIFLN